jgi:hypothetical protein
MPNETMSILMTTSRDCPSLGLLEAGEKYTIGASFGQQLCDQGYAVKASNQTKKTTKKKEPAKSVAMAAIVDAIRKLDDGENKEDFTDDGKPNANILSKICGFDVSAEMRDEAWELYNSENTGD